MLQNIIPFRSTDDRISSRVRNPIIFLIERVAQGKKNFAIAFSISLSIEEKALGRKGRKVSRGFLGFSIKFSTTKGWRAVVGKRKIDCLRMGGIIKQKRECPSVFKLSLFFFFTGKSRNGVSTFSAIVLPFYKPMRAPTEGGRRRFYTIQHLQFCYSRWLNIHSLLSIFFFSLLIEAISRHRECSVD